MAQWELSYANGTINAIISDSSITSCVFALAGQTFTGTVTNGVTSLPMAVHESVSNMMILVTVNAGGTQQNTINIGGVGTTTMALQVYTDPVTNLQTVGPVGNGSLNYLRQFYDVQAGISQEEQSGDLLTITGILVDLVCQLAQGKTLSANALNLVTDLQTNIVANLPVTSETAAPVPASGSAQVYDPSYGQYRVDAQAASSSVKAFLTAISSIPNLA